MDDSPSPSSPNPNPNASDRHSPSPSLNQTLTLTLATQTPATAGSTGGGREDCWSEGATTTLIDAWGERYLHLSRGNLKQRHWQEVADAVTARDGSTKTPRTEHQCKNRIDTLKKKYKSEKSRIAASGQSRPSTWRFFRRLDRLLGAGAAAGPPPVPAFPPQFPQRLRTRKRYRSPVSVSSGTSDSLPPSPSPPPPAARASEGVGEVTRAVLRLAEVYERVERTKARQAAEAERRWLEFVRELELQRMQFFVRTQMELSQLRRKRPHHRRRQRSGRRSSSTDSNGNANANDNHHYSNNNGDGENDGDNME